MLAEHDMKTESDELKPNMVTFMAAHTTSTTLN
jgi:hypothetical protein